MFSEVKPQSLYEEAMWGIGGNKWLIQKILLAYALVLSFALGICNVFAGIGGCLQCSPGHTVSDMPPPRRALSSVWGRLCAPEWSFGCPCWRNNSVFIDCYRVASEMAISLLVQQRWCYKCHVLPYFDNKLHFLLIRIYLTPLGVLYCSSNIRNIPCTYFKLALNFWAKWLKPGSQVFSSIFNLFV